jgi:hypothetical protein
MTDENPEYKGDKFNKGKTMLSLIEPIFLEGLGKVLTYGANKYEKNNWKKGIPEDELIDALLRHLLAFKSGEIKDPESGLDHRDHVACNLMFWRYLYPKELSALDQLYINDATTTDTIITQTFTFPSTCQCGTGTINTSCPLHGVTTS